MEAEEKTSEINAFISSFQAQFCAKFGVVPKIHYTIDEKQNIITLKDLDEISEGIVDKKLYPEGIRTKKRYRDLVLLRQGIFTIARDLDIRYQSIGDYFGFDHATIIHSTRTLRALLQVKNPEAIRTMKLINNGLKNKFGDDGVFQHYTQERINA